MLFLTDEKKISLDACFSQTFGTAPARYFSAPGRTEVGGNHTDHQHGCVLAGAVNLDAVAAVRPNGTNTIRFLSKGYPLCQVDLTNLTPDSREFGTTVALIRGVAARITQLGYRVSGFDAYCESTVLSGSGLSSSAAFEVLVGTICNGLFCDSRLTAVEIAQIGQFAENVFFGKPCGLMDQMASSVGGLVYIDFADPAVPEVCKIDFDFASAGHALCILDTGADHADLTDEYAAVTLELKALCACFEKEYLRQIPEADFRAKLPELRSRVGDRAVLRALHVYEENRRVAAQRDALEKGDFDGFLTLVRQSGLSSWRFLQNVVPAGRTKKQEMAVALALAETLLAGRGACRVHGGGFAGTIQAFVPTDLLEQFRSGMEAVFGAGSCYVLSIRREGGTELT